MQRQRGAEAGSRVRHQRRAGPPPPPNIGPAPPVPLSLAFFALGGLIATSRVRTCPFLSFTVRSSVLFLTWIGRLPAARAAPGRQAAAQAKETGASGQGWAGCRSSGRPFLRLENYYSRLPALPVWSIACLPLGL